MTPKELAKLLQRDQYHVLDIVPQNFVELEHYLRSRAYTYRPGTRQLKIKMASQIHASVSDWAAGLKFQGKELNAFHPRDLLLVPGGRLIGFAGQYQGITKVPDCAIYPRGRSWPTIVFEVGYTEEYDDLKADVKLLLEGSSGKISKVFLIKLDPIYGGVRKIQKGFIEAWKLSNGVATKDLGRENLYPIPKSHADQEYVLTFEEVFRNRLDALTNDGWDKDHILRLRLDDLRPCVEEGIWRHLVQKGVLVDNDN
ncbi:hypothetical protein B9Z19DRAFT_497898 [Tuber borchii]|uniref:Uncharacterized protein n=1 Tax=Tuber borchii TaxID=42251 RepID=A0A2T6ZEF0_TUBBO|nr:hypothetical protein B9Z19DRAFT_497898 [Tuber borchii]